MIENTAEKLADAFVSHGLIPEGQKGAYVYTLICNKSRDFVKYDYPYWDGKEPVGGR